MRVGTKRERQVQPRPKKSHALTVPEIRLTQTHGRSSAKIQPTKMQQEMESSYGRRLLIDIIEETVAKDPSRPFVFVPRTRNPQDGWDPLSFKDILQAIDHLAWKITETYGPGFQGQDRFRTLAYMGTSDIRYIIIMLACIKAGYQALFLSPRNSKDAQHALLEVNECDLFWYSDSFQALAHQLSQERQLTTATVPTLHDLIASPPRPFPYHRTFEQGKWDPAVVLHTSGSTGAPKSLVIKQGAFAIVDAYRCLPKFHENITMVETWTKVNRFFSPMPLFHIGGIMFLLLMTVLYETPVVLSIPDRPLDANLVIECLESSGSEGTLVAPAILEEISKNKESIAKIAKLRVVGFGGGNFSTRAGQILADSGVVLSNGISSTEYVCNSEKDALLIGSRCAPYPIYFQSQIHDWQYFIFNSEVMGIKWHLYSKEDNLYELIFHRKKPDVKDPGMQGIFYTFPHLDEWSPKDLYQPHPTLPDHWRYAGRVDDLIVFSNGEKFNPIPMEGIIISHPALKGALVVGQDKFQAALILEPTSFCHSESEEQKLIDDIWPLVEEANADTVTHGRLVKWLVLVAKPDKPLVRTPKGTIARAENNKRFKYDIDLLYEKQYTGGEHHLVSLNFDDEQSLMGSVIDIFKSIAGNSKSLGADTDFFRLGFDSLQVIIATRMINIGLQKQGKDSEAQLMPRVIYENSTPRQLSTVLFSIAQPEKSGLSDGRSQKMDSQGLLSKYTQDMSPLHLDKPEPLDEAQVIVLTGTTGSLGTHLLDRLCKLGTVRKVIALNRGEDGGRTRQFSAADSRGLSTDFSKVEFLRAELSLPDFGLGQDKYNELLQVTDRVIHNAWPVNFNMNVQSFEPHIRGVRHLVNFSKAATKRVPITFLSTVATVFNWTEARPVPEEQLSDFGLAGMGYGQSKLISSLILDCAASQGIPAASIRIGQIAGSKYGKGRWNRQELIPSLISSSLFLGALPTDLGRNQTIDWVSIEDVANIVLDIAGITVNISSHEISGYFNLVNPTQVDWSTVVAAIKAYYGDKIQKMVSLEEWVSLLEKSADESNNVERNPGIKLIDAYRDMITGQNGEKGYASLCLERTKARSPSMKGIHEITPELITTWCDQWSS